MLIFGLKETNNTLDLDQLQNAVTAKRAQDIGISCADFEWKCALC
jgi:hypothetical protein